MTNKSNIKKIKLFNKLSKSIQEINLNKAPMISNNIIRQSNKDYTNNKRNMTITCYKDKRNT